MFDNLLDPSHEYSLEDYSRHCIYWDELSIIVKDAGIHFHSQSTLSWYLYALSKKVPKTKLLVYDNKLKLPPHMVFNKPYIIQYCDMTRCLITIQGLFYHVLCELTIPIIDTEYVWNMVVECQNRMITLVQQTSKDSLKKLKFENKEEETEFLEQLNVKEYITDQAPNLNFYFDMDNYLTTLVRAFFYHRFLETTPVKNQHINEQFLIEYAKSYDMTAFREQVLEWAYLLIVWEPLKRIWHRKLPSINYETISNKVVVMDINPTIRNSIPRIDIFDSPWRKFALDVAFILYIKTSGTFDRNFNKDSFFTMNPQPQTYFRDPLIRCWIYYDGEIFWSSEDIASLYLHQCESTNTHTDLFEVSGLFSS